MDNNFTVDAALITAIAVIIAPTITALIHSFKEYKIAKLDHTLEARLKLCELFSDTYSKCQYGPEKVGYMTTFYKQTLKLIAICHKRRVRASLFKLANQVLSHGASKETDKLYEQCIRLLAKEF